MQRSKVEGALRMKSLLTKLGIWIALGFGSGKSPWAPGTAGSVVGVAYEGFLRYLDVPLHLRIAFWIFWCGIATWSASVYAHFFNKSDPKEVVVDEIVGMGAVLTGFDWELKEIVAGFLLFRFFDILKPPPISWVDRWSKNQTKGLKTGLGILLDDLFAAACSVFVIGVGKHFF